MHAHPNPILAVGAPGAKYANIAAAMASPEIVRVGALMRTAGLNAMTAPMEMAEIDGKLAQTTIPPTQRIELKIALQRVGLVK